MKNMLFGILQIIWVLIVIVLQLNSKWLNELSRIAPFDRSHRIIFISNFLHSFLCYCKFDTMQLVFFYQTQIISNHFTVLCWKFDSIDRKSSTYKTPMKTMQSLKLSLKINNVWFSHMNEKCLWFYAQRSKS